MIRPKVCKECQFENGAHSQACSQRETEENFFGRSVASTMARSGGDNYPPGFDPRILD